MLLICCEITPQPTANEAIPGPARGLVKGLTTSRVFHNGGMEWLEFDDHSILAAMGTILNAV